MYLIDRAGQLRFADVENRSLKSAVAFLLRETADDAIANAKKQSQGIEVAMEPEKKAVPEILPALYKRADWPMKNSGKLNAKNYQGKALPVALGNEEWISKERDLEGKVIVLDFWATWCGPCKRASPTLDKLQKQFEGKLEVLAIGGQSEDERKVRKYAASHKVAYAHLFDKKQSIYRKLEIRAIPHTIVMSTDGVIRWQGNPLSPAFKKAVEQVIEQDPMFAED
jgi:thiol-disulfide isomerase/thioredoxin